MLLKEGQGTSVLCLDINCLDLKKNNHRSVRGRQAKVAQYPKERTSYWISLNSKNLHPQLIPDVFTFCDLGIEFALSLFPFSLNTAPKLQSSVTSHNQIIKQSYFKQKAHNTKVHLSGFAVSWLSLLSKWIECVYETCQCAQYYTLMHECLNSVCYWLLFI